MAKVRILKKQNQAYLELPPELFNQEEVELFKLKDGFYLLSLPLDSSQSTSVSQHQTTQNSQSANSAPKKDSKDISKDERVVLKKLLAIRFENRIPPNVNKTFSDPEKKILKDLEAKKFLTIFKSAKYKEGVYSINDSIYPLIMQNNQSIQSSQQNSAASTPNQNSSDPFTILKSQGFIVLADKNEARTLSEKLSQYVKTGEFVGIKGFDGKFYMVSREYFGKVQSLISKILTEDMDANSIAAASKTDPDGCTAVLRLMAEGGDIMEKRKGFFAPV